MEDRGSVISTSVSPPPACWQESRYHTTVYTELGGGVLWREG